MPDTRPFQPPRVHWLVTVALVLGALALGYGVGRGHGRDAERGEECERQRARRGEAFGFYQCP